MNNNEILVNIDVCNRKDVFLFDGIAISTKNNMDIYCDLYNNLCDNNENNYLQLNINIYCENILYYHLKKNNINILLMDSVYINRNK
jgi:hypothetical protein